MLEALDQLLPTQTAVEQEIILYLAQLLLQAVVLVLPHGVDILQRTAIPAAPAVQVVAALNVTALRVEPHRHLDKAMLEVRLMPGVEAILEAEAAELELPVQMRQAQTVAVTVVSDCNLL